jgi:hypothetical protein
MLQESYPPALTILKGFIPVWTQYIQKVILGYNSIVHTSYMGGTDGHTWKWYTQTISSTHVQDMCMYIHCMNVYMQCMYMVHTKSVPAHTGFNQLFQQETDNRLRRRQLWRKGACAELRLACVARLIGPDEKISEVVELYSPRRVCTMYIHIYNHERVCTMYIHNFTFMNMYVYTTYIYTYSCISWCTYTFMLLQIHYMSVLCSGTYVPFCPILSRWVGFQMTCND